MPYVKIELFSGRTKEQKAEIAKEITETLQRHAGARPEATSVVFQDVERDNWANAGTLMSER
jgi:4-oxalocrotonate tautomerase